MLNTYMVEGGIGKNIAFTAVIDKLAEKDGEPIQVFTPYMDVIANNQNVKMGYEGGSIPLTHPEIMKSDNIIYAEPYKSNFVFGKQHLIESYCELLNIEYDVDMRPKIYSDYTSDIAKDFLKKREITGPYIMVQFTGGQSPINWQQSPQYMNHMPLRNYPHFLANKVVQMLREKYPNTAIIDCTLPNEPSYPDTNKFEGPWIVLHELLKNALGFVSIDSMLQHMSTSAGTKGVVMWGSSGWNQFGYPENTNLSFHQGQDWDSSKFDPEDPRNICVDPEKVVSEFNKLVE